MPEGNILLGIEGLSTDQHLKLGSLVADQLGVKNVEINPKTRVVMFNYKGYGIILKNKR